MSQRDHWKKKRGAIGLRGQRKSWLSVDNENRSGTARPESGQQGGSRRNPQQDPDQR